MIPTPLHSVACYGEILWDILPTAALPGGAPMNVAYHLQKLGNTPVLITKVGRDDYGQKLMDLLTRNGLPTACVQVDEHQPTGLVYAKPDEHNEVTYDIVYPSAWDFIEWQQEYTSWLQQSEYFIYGSLTSRSEVSRDTLYQLLESAQTKVLDINLRPPHFSQAGIEYLLQKADVLKMNSAELELVSGWYGDVPTAEDRIQLLQDRFRIETIIVTMGGQGALVKDSGSIHRHPGYKVIVADTIGSGDAFLAGFIHQKLHAAPVEEALEFACAMGAFIATQQGACPSYELRQITDLINAQAAPGN